MSQYKKDMIASFFFLILGALVLISVPLTIQDPGVSVMGPRVFPYFIGACMVILSLALMLTTIVKHRKAGGADSTGTFASEEERKRALRDELRALLPPERPVLVLGVGNRCVTFSDSVVFYLHASGSHRYSAYFPREKDLGLPGGLCRGGSHLGGIYLPALRETALRGGEEHD